MGTVEQGARNAVVECMGVRSGERVLIISDRATERIGKALANEAESISGHSNVQVLYIEDLAKRPIVALPPKIKQLLQSWANVTFWAAESLPGELIARHEFLDAFRAAKVRHGHMPNITEELMEQGMCADYEDVYELTHRIYDIVKHCQVIHVSNHLGVNLEVEFDPSWKWIPSDGRYYEPGKWGNLPEGETFTAPKRVNGILKTNLLGDWFSAKYGNFKETMSLEVKDSIIQLDTLETANQKLKSDILTYLKTEPNSSRASEFALPTNSFLMSLPTVGNLLQDEKARVHIAFGDPYQAETGAPWRCATHVDMLLEQCDIVIDGTKIMSKGNYVV